MYQKSRKTIFRIKNNFYIMVFQNMGGRKRNFVNKRNRRIEILKEKMQKSL